MSRPHVPCVNEYEYRGLTWDPTITKDILKKVEQFEFRPDDVILSSFPRSGTTLTQVIIWQILNRDKIVKGMELGYLNWRYFLEVNAKLEDEQLRNPVDILNEMTRKRYIKTHLPYFILKHQLEKVNPKMIVVMRNPKDCAVSYFNFYKMATDFGWNGDWEDFLSIFLNGKTLYGDYFANNLEWWSLRDRRNVLIVKYEDLVHQKHQEIRKIAAFLGCQLSPEQMDIILHNTNFKVMQNDRSNDLFKKDGEKVTHLRKGVSGDWTTTFTVAQNELMDKYAAEKFDGTGLCFYYD